MTIWSESNNAFSEAHNDAMLPPVKNTFYHFDTSFVPPAGPSELLRLQTCPAELGMSYFFEKIGRAPPCAPAVGSRCPPPTLPAAKSVQWADNDYLVEEERNLAGPAKEETVTKVAEEKTQPSAEEEQAKPVEKKKQDEKQNEEEALGEFFAVKKKKRRCSGRAPSQEVRQTTKTEEEAALPATAAEEQKPAAEEVEKKTPAPADEDESSASFPAFAEEEEKQELSKEQPAQASTAPRQSRPRWADLEESDGEEQVKIPPLVPARSRWANIEADNSPMTPPAPAPAREEAEQRRLQRPVFGRPGREARVRQARTGAEEICSLEFDEVDASSQMGLVGRMLVMLKSLAQAVVFWEGEEKREEEKFRLLGLEEDDMYAIGKGIRRAEKKIDDRNFREAFDQMCEARRWLRDPEWAAAERAQRAQRAEKTAAREEDPTKESKRKKKSTVAKEGPVAAAAEEEEWQVVGGAGAEKKKKRKEAEKIQQVATAVRNTAQAKGSRCGAEEPKQTSAPSAKAQQPPVSQPAARGRAPWSSSGTQRPAAPAPAIAPCRSVAGAPREATKFLCRFTVGIEPEVKGGFRVCRKIFGPGGENMKSIALGTNAKLRLRGRGSGFKEGPELREADEPLVLCLSTEDPEGYKKAVVQVMELFERIYQEYQAHCKRHGLPDSESRLAIQLQEHPGNPRC